MNKIIIIFMLISFNAYSHSGKTYDSGCHINNKLNKYHCHKINGIYKHHSK